MASIAEDIIALVILELVVIRLLVVAAGMCMLVMGTAFLQTESQLTEFLA